MSDDAVFGGKFNPVFMMAYGGQYVRASVRYVVENQAVSGSTTDLGQALRWHRLYGGSLEWVVVEVPV